MDNSNEKLVFLVLKGGYVVKVKESEVPILKAKEREDAD